MDAKEIHQYSEIALASYGTFAEGSLQTQEESLKKDAGTAQIQAEEFAKKYSAVLPTYTDPVSDLDVTVFKDAGGNLTLGIRGTVPSGHDLFITDANIALNGAGYDQIVALYNWWTLVATPAGQTVQQYQTLPNGKIVSTTSVPATGVLAAALAADPDHKIDVTGHSLGGHLAMAFNKFFPTVTGQVVVFDAPGFIDNTINREFFSQLGGVVPTIANSGNVINLIANEVGIGNVPFDGIAGLHSRPGTPIQISIEDQTALEEPGSFGAFNHSMVTLSDSLAIYDLLSKIDTALSTDAYHQLLEQAAAGTAASYERLVDGLQKLLGIDKVDLPFGNNQRDALYAALYGVQENTLYQSLSGAKIISIVPSAQQAKVDFGAFLALDLLTPFYIEDRSTAFGSAHAENYTEWLADQLLTPQQRAAGEANYSDQWLNDRMTMLGFINARNLQNIPDGQASHITGLYSYDFAALKFNPDGTDLRFAAMAPGDTGSQRIQFVFGSEFGDTISGQDIHLGDHLYGGGGQDKISGAGGDDYIEGNDDIDTLDGDDGRDTLVGGAGADILTGGKNSDMLKGGKDFDTYKYKSGDGTDTILDSDGQGKIEYDGVVLGNGNKIADNLWESDDEEKKFLYSLISEADGTKTLSIIRKGSSTGERIFIKEFSTGELGINLKSPPDEAVPTDLVVQGDLKPVDPVDFDHIGNVLVTGAAKPGFADRLYGDIGNDKLYGKGGNDLLTSREGDDSLEGGDGDDVLTAGHGEDTLVGGEGNDYLFGGASLGSDEEGYEPPQPPVSSGWGWSTFYDEVVVTDSPDKLQVIVMDGLAGTLSITDGTDFLYGGKGNDMLEGGWGDDVLFGEENNDTLTGMAGHDVLDGGGGADYLEGDGSHYNFVLSYTPFEDQGNDMLRGGGGNDSLIGQGGSDVLYGEDGKDILYGDNRDLKDTPEIYHGIDYLDGGKDDDFLEGGGAADELYGGEGADTLLGDGKTSGDGETLNGSFHGEDYLDGGEGNDYLEGGGKDDTLSGGAGKDTLIGDSSSGLEGQYHGADYLDGGDDDDYIEGGGGSDALIGAKGDDTLFGDGTGVPLDRQEGDYLSGGAGKDYLGGGGGDDVLLGDEDDDTLYGDEGNDALEGGIGNDYLDGGIGDDTLDGGTGQDYLAGGDGNDTYVIRSGQSPIEGNVYEGIVDSSGANIIQFLGMSRGDLTARRTSSGDVTINFGAGNGVLLVGATAASISAIEVGGESISLQQLLEEGLIGGGDNDTLLGSDGEDDIQGQGGDDHLAGGDGIDLISGGGGSDFLFGDGGDDRLAGDEDDDHLEGGDGADELKGGSGNDSLLGQGGNDLLFGEDGDDILGGGAGDDLQSGGEGNDHLKGDEGADILSGDEGNDYVEGSDGDDTIIGGEGSDTLQGGEGNDVYVFSLGDGADHIADQSGANTLRFGEGIAISDIVLSQAVDQSDGGKYLVLNYGTGNQVFIKDGFILGSVANYDFSGTIVNQAALLDRMSSSLDLSGGLGDEKIQGGAGDDSIDGGGGADTLYGGYGDDQLTGGDGNDQIYGDGGNDQLFGGDGSDTYHLGRGIDNDVLHESESEGASTSTDVIEVAAGISTSEVSISRSGFDLLLTLQGGLDSIRVAGYFDTAIDSQRIEQIHFADGPTWDNAYIDAMFVQMGNGDDHFVGTSAGEVVDGLGGNDSLEGLGGDDYLSGSAGRDTLLGGTGNDQLFGGTEADSLAGGDGRDTLDGGSGNDSLEGGAGDDYLLGKDGSDHYYFIPNSGRDIVIETNQPGSADVDVLHMAPAMTPENISLSVIANDDGLADDLRILDKNTNSSLIIQDFFKYEGDIGGVEEILFSNAVWNYADIVRMIQSATIDSDIIQGFEYHDVLDGLAGNDSIKGVGGGDLIRGNLGDDDLDGGVGNDSLEGGDGDDYILSGTGDDTIDGGAGDDSLLGVEGNDRILFGRGDGHDILTDKFGTFPIDPSLLGSDTLALKAGVAASDVGLYRVGNDLVLTISGDTAQFWVKDYFSSTNKPIEKIEFQGGGPIWDSAEINGRAVVGTQNQVTGTSADDVFIVDHVSDQVIEALDGGNDTVQSSVSYRLPVNVENLTLTGTLDIGAYGNTLNNILRGNAANNYFASGGGADVAYGGAGDDTYESDLSVIEYAGGGQDTFVGSSLSYFITLPENVEILDGRNVGHMHGAGGIFDAGGPDVFTGNAQDNIIIGSDNASTWFQTDAPSDYFGDRLNGAGGNDTLIEGINSSTNFVIDSAGDRIVLAKDGGDTFDTVESYINYQIISGIDQITLLGSDPVSAVGDASDNKLSAYLNTAANMLTGGDGNDEYLLGVGDRAIEGETGGDQDKVRVFLDGTGSIYASDYANIEILQAESQQYGISVYGDNRANTLYVNHYFNGSYSGPHSKTYGGAGNDELHGYLGNDLLDGEDGADLLIGSAGDDTYVVDNTADQIVENYSDFDELYETYRDGGDDTVRSSVNFTLGQYVENLSLTGSAAITATGNEFDNILSGDENAASNILTGLGGDDHYYVGQNDVVQESADGGIDTVHADFSIYALPANIENIQLEGQTNANATGTSTDNRIIGNRGDNILRGEGGDDFLSGQGGNNVLDGGVGDDVYWIDYSYAHNLISSADKGVGKFDLLHFEFSSTECISYRDGQDLVFVYVYDSSSTRVAGYYDTQNGTRIEKIEFVDGVIFSTADAIANNITGSSNDDALTGTTGKDAIFGLDGNDRLDGGDADDLLDGGSGADTLFGDVGVDYLRGGDGNDSLDGGDGDDLLEGGAGDDFYSLTQGDGVVELEGGGIDTIEINLGEGGIYLNANVENIYLLGSGPVSAEGNELNNYLRGNKGKNLLIGGAGDDTLEGGDAIDTMRGGIGDDEYAVIQGGDVIDEEINEGIDTVRSTVSYTLANNVEKLFLTGTGKSNGTGNDLDNTITGNDKDNILKGLGGHDTIDGGSGNDSIEGAAGNDSLEGGAGADTLLGGAGNDWLSGGTGKDTLTGGGGNDTYVVDDAGDQVNENPSEGTDTVQSSVEYTLGANMEHLLLTGAGAINGTGNALANAITGNGANNVLSGGGDNDTLAGGKGADNLQGGIGGDVYRFNLGDGQDIIVESGGVAGEIDRIEFGAGIDPEDVAVTQNGMDLCLTLAAGDKIVVKNFFSGAATEIEEVKFGNVSWDKATLIGFLQTNHAPVLALPLANQAIAEDATFSFTVPANSFTDVDAGNVLTLSAGLANGAALPTWLVFNPTTRTFSGTPPNTAAGFINVRVTATDNFGATATGDFVLDVANHIVGNTGANTLDGTGMDPTIRDVMEGLTGNDLYKVDNVGDEVRELSGGGTDTVESSVSFSLSGEVENLTLLGTAAINGTGNILNNKLIGNSGANALAGGAGNDTYVVSQGDTVTENLNEGTDSVESDVSFTLGNNIENLTLTGSTAVSGTGNALDNLLKADTNSAANALAGGVGNDTYTVGQGDTVTENPNEGTDSVESYVSFTLGNNVENLSLKGSALINATGNSLDNVLNGNEAANTLNGDAGADTMSGDAGDDVYVVDNVGDVVQESSGKGTDLVESTVSYTLGTNVENLTLTGSVALTAEGNTLNNVLVGNTLNNRMSGKAGIDTMSGGAGDDTYEVYESGDVVMENAGEGIDLVESKLLDYTLGNNVENLILIGADTVHGKGTGNGLNNRLTGNNGNNSLTGGLGNDTLIGEGGNDTMVGGGGDDFYEVNGADILTENSGEGTDTVRIGASYTLLSNFEYLELSGSGNFGATGNTANNKLTGNSGNNSLSGGTGLDTMDGKGGNDIYVVDNVGDVVTEDDPAGGLDLVQTSVDFTLTANIEDLTLTSTTGRSLTGNAFNNSLTGNSGNDTLIGGDGNDILDGKAGNDSLRGGFGDDLYKTTAGDTVQENSGEGWDVVQSADAFNLSANANVEAFIVSGTATTVLTITGNAAANLIRTGQGKDIINGGGGNDLLEGGGGADTITDTSGTGYLNGGGGNDTMTGGAGNEIYIGGVGNDSITTGTGADIIVFNAGDGLDKITLSTGADNTISLGGGITYEELFFQKSGNDLILKTNGTGTTESITLAGWYASGNTNKSVANLQVIVESMAGFDTNSSNPLKDDKVEQFNFLELVKAFDNAGAPTNWALTNALSAWHLSGSDTAAMGGDLAYQYGMTGSLGNVGVTGAQNVINAGSFGSSAQTFQDQNALQQGVVRLS